jgi:hypothetical protein
MSADITPQAAILTILEEEQRLYDRLIAVAEAKRDALVTGDVDACALLVREMDVLMSAVDRLEDDRIAQVALLAPEGAPENFAALVPHFRGEALGRLESLREGLRAALSRLRALNDVNAALVRHALVMTEQWSRFVRAALPATYAPSGAVVGPALLHGRTWTV